MFVPYRVLLPERIFEKSISLDEQQLLITKYMQRYPNYELKYTEEKFAICERVEA